MVGIILINACNRFNKIHNPPFTKPIPQHTQFVALILISTYVLLIYNSSSKTIYLKCDFRLDTGG